MQKWIEMDAGEFRKKYLSLGEAFYRVARYILESDADAEDAVQDLYVKLWNSRDVLDTVRNPRAYGITLLRNICIDRIRSNGRFASGEMQENIPAADSADSGMFSREQFSRVMEAVEKLPEGERAVLKMRVFEDMSYNEISALTGKSGLTLRVLLSNARRKIRKAML